jgi:hypothetical protein
MKLHPGRVTEVPDGQTPFLADKMRLNNGFKRGRKTVAISSITPPKTEKVTKAISKADRELELAETSEESHGSCCHLEQGALKRIMAEHSDVSGCGSKIEEVEECTSDMPSTKKVRGTVLALAWALEGQHIAPKILTPEAEGDDVSFDFREKSEYPGEPEIEWYPQAPKRTVVTKDISDCAVDMDVSVVGENTPSGIADMEISSCYLGYESMAGVQAELGPTIDELIEMQSAEIMAARKQRRSSKKISRNMHSENVNPNTNQLKPALPKQNSKITKKSGKQSRPAPCMLPERMSKMR